MGEAVRVVGGGWTSDAALELGTGKERVGRGFGEVVASNQSSNYDWTSEIDEDEKIGERR
jgi:hypothetical protein